MATESMYRGIEEVGKKALERLRESNEAEATGATPPAPPEPEAEPEAAPEPEPETPEVPEPPPADDDEETLPQETTEQEPDEEDAALADRILFLRKRQDEERKRTQQAEAPPPPAPPAYEQGGQVPQPREMSPPQPTPAARWTPREDDFVSETEKRLYEQNRTLAERLDSYEQRLRQRDEEAQRQRLNEAYAGLQRTVQGYQSAYPDVFDKASPLAKIAAREVEHRMLHTQTEDDPELIVAEVARDLRAIRRADRSDYVKKKLKQSKGRTLSGASSKRTGSGRGAKKKTTARDLETGAVVNKALARLRASAGSGVDLSRP